MFEQLYLHEIAERIHRTVLEISIGFVFDQKSCLSALHSQPLQARTAGSMLLVHYILCSIVIQKIMKSYRRFIEIFEIWWWVNDLQTSTLKTLSYAIKNTICSELPLHRLDINYSPIPCSETVGTTYNSHENTIHNHLQSLVLAFHLWFISYGSAISTCVYSSAPHHRLVAVPKHTTKSRLCVARLV